MQGIVMNVQILEENPDLMHPDDYSYVSFLSSELVQMPFEGWKCTASFNLSAGIYIYLEQSLFSDSSC